MADGPGVVVAFKDMEEQRQAEQTLRERDAILATVGQPVRWLNGDDSPHQITVTKTKERSVILTKGQSAVMAFNTPGSYDYICGLHPSMKGTVEVK